LFIFRNNVYYMSLAYGFAGAAAFLGLTLLGSLFIYRKIILIFR